MNKYLKILIIVLLFFVFFILFKYNYIISTSVIDGTNLWLNKVFPSLFIMFILNDLIINFNILEPINKLLNKPFNKLFNTSGNSINAFLLSIFSGTPSSVFIIKEMLNNNTITLNDANKLISFTFFSNPLFLYNILSLSFNKYITFKIIIIYYLSNIIIGLFFRNKYISNITNYKINNDNKKFLVVLPNSIKKSLDTLFMILGTIIFYMILSNLLINIFPLNNLFNTILKGILEITQSLNSLPNLNILSIKKEIIAISIISFGGLSIHTQVLSLINNTNIKYYNFLIGRILHVLISLTTYLSMYSIFSC